MVKVTTVTERINSYACSANIQVEDETHLHLLLYYTQAWHLAWEGTPLFEEPIFAQETGVIIPAVAGQWNGDGNSSGLNESADATVVAVMEFYRDCSRQQLAGMCCEETPWAETWMTPLSDTSEADGAIPLEGMRRFYTRALLTNKNGNVPTRDTPYGTVSEEGLMTAVARAEEQWRETLAILAE